jgi:DNA-directed RNA polymerase specialized sigma subunit
VKIALNLKQGDQHNQEQDREHNIERDVMNVKKSDWEAKARLVQSFMPLMMSMAKKRTHEVAAINRHIEAGKEGLMTAVRRYKPGTGQKFEVFALGFIEGEMDRLNRPGLLARLFGRR